MSLKDKAISFIVNHPGCKAKDVMLAVDCKRSLAYEALSDVEKGVEKKK